MDNYVITGLKLKPQKRKKRRWVWGLLFIIVGIVSVLVISRKSPAELVSPLSKIRIDNSLKSVVENNLTGAKGTYGVAIKNLKSGESYYLSEHRSFEAGSLYKLWIMATVFKQIQEGKLTEDQVLSEDIATLNEKFNIDSDSAELTEGAVTYTVHDALVQMITISHNYAALLLTEKIKLSSAANFLKESGFKESSVGTEGDAPKTTPADIALFYEKLYKGELANPQYTQEMIDLLKGQQLNDGLPKYLPEATPVASAQSSDQKPSIVAHKTGDIGWFKHDAGIIYTSKGDYIITIMSESDYPPGAQERIALVSKAVYEYFAKK